MDLIRIYLEDFLCSAPIISVTGRPSATHSFPSGPLKKHTNKDKCNLFDAINCTPQFEVAPAQFVLAEERPDREVRS